MAGRKVSASAPGKVILFGEHAVVYGYPAIAAPVLDLHGDAIVEEIAASRPAGSVQIDAPDIGLHASLASLPLDNPISLAVRGAILQLSVKNPPALRLTISSTIPVAAGLGSGAAVSVAIIRAMAAFFERSLPDDIVSAMAFEIEKVHHGRPSGIDNTVITYAQPIFFQHGKPFEILPPRRPFTIVIADTGIASPTAAAVAGVKERFDANPVDYKSLFEEIGQIASEARELITSGSTAEAGNLMNRNHDLLRRIGVSCDALDRLVHAAREAGALGAKLSGGGLGGNMIALVDACHVEKVSFALREAGAVRCFHTTINPSAAGLKR